MGAGTFDYSAFSLRDFRSFSEQVETAYRALDMAGRRLQAEQLRNASDAERTRALTRLGMDVFGVDEDDARGMTTVVNILHWWKKLGRKTFYIAPDLAQMLQNTETGAVDSSWLKLPFNYVLLQLPLGAMALTHVDGSLHPVQSLLVSSATDVNNTPMLIAVAIYGDAYGTFAMEIREGRSVKEAAANVVNDKSDPGVKAAIELLTGIVCYISSRRELKESDSPGKELMAAAHRKKSSKKRAKIERRANEHGLWPRYILGEGIVITDEHGNPASTFESGRTINCRFMVRGHWRNQAYGPGRSKRKLLWIKPFWKGPKNAAELVQRYIVT